MRFAVLVLVSLVGTAGCTTRADLEQVPVGATVEVTRQDGGVVRGTLASRDDTSVTVAAADVLHAIPRAEISGVRVVEAPVTPVAASPAPPPAVAAFTEVTVPEGTRLTARLGSSVSSESSHAGDPIEATLTRAIVIEGVEVVPSGSTISGVVGFARPSGKVTGRASLVLTFSSIAVAGLRTPQAIVARVSVRAPATKRSDAAKIGIPAAGGAIIGGLIGGKKGAAIGAVAGGGAGTAVVLSTSGRQVSLLRGAVVSPRLERALTVRVPVAGS